MHRSVAAGKSGYLQHSGPDYSARKDVSQVAKETGLSCKQLCRSFSKGDYLS